MLCILNKIVWRNNSTILLFFFIASFNWLNGNLFQPGVKEQGGCDASFFCSGIHNRRGRGEKHKTTTIKVVLYFFSHLSHSNSIDLIAICSLSWPVIRVLFLISSSLIVSAALMVVSHSNHFLLSLPTYWYFDWFVTIQKLINIINVMIIFVCSQLTNKFTFSFSQIFSKLIINVLLKRI